MSPPSTVVVTGAAGQVGREVVARFAAIPRTEVIGLTRAECDTSDYHQVMRFLVPLGPDLIVHTGAWTDVDACEADPGRAYLHNALAVRHVRLAARAVGADLIHLSTDYVFDGRSDRPYREWDPTNPLSVYGASKLAGEKEALLWERSFVVRTSWLLGAGRNFVRAIRARAQAGEVLRVVDDQRGRPTLAVDLADALALLWRSARYGLWHVANAGPTTWFDLAMWTLWRAGFEAEIEPVSTAELARPAPRPANSVLDDHLWEASGFPPMRPWDEALGQLWSEVSTPVG